MNPNTVITIGRQFGSGGCEVGKKIAETCGFTFYDRELLQLAAQKSGICREIFESHDEKPAESLFFSSWSVPFHASELPLGQQVFLAQFNLMKEIAEKGGCVIVGRAADFVLAGRPNLVRVFLHCPLEVRVRRVSERFRISEEEARKKLRRIEKDRMSFYNYFSDRKWGATETYDLCVNTEKLSAAQTAGIIRAYAESVSP